MTSTLPLNSTALRKYNTVLNTEYSNEADNVETGSSNRYSHTLDMKKWQERGKRYLLAESGSSAQQCLFAFHWLELCHMVSLYERKTENVASLVGHITTFNFPKKEEVNDIGYSKI